MKPYNPSKRFSLLAGVSTMFGNALAKIGGAFKVAQRDRTKAYQAAIEKHAEGYYRGKLRVADPAYSSFKKISRIVGRGAASVPNPKVRDVIRHHHPRLQRAELARIMRSLPREEQNASVARRHSVMLRARYYAKDAA